MGDKRLLEPEGPGGGSELQAGDRGRWVITLSQEFPKDREKEGESESWRPPDTASLQGRNCSAGAKQALRSTTTTSMAAPDGFA